MLGHKLAQRFADNFEVIATVRGVRPVYDKFGIFRKAKLIELLDVTDLQTVRKIFEKVNADVAINCIGIIKQIPAAENVIETIRINTLLPHQLAEIAGEFGAKLITVGTDCVFDGADGMYSEEDFPNAKDLYGKSKHLGEVVYGDHLTLRTSIIGREINTSSSLIEWFLSNRGKAVKGFANAFFSGFPTVVFADIISDLILTRKDLRGLFHVSSEPISKFELLTLVNQYFAAKVEIEKFEDFQIDRSLDSTKFRNAIGFKPKPWNEMIEQMARDAVQYSQWR